MGYGAPAPPPAGAGFAPAGSAASYGAGTYTAVGYGNAFSRILVACKVFGIAWCTVFMRPQGLFYGQRRVCMS